MSPHQPTVVPSSGVSDSPSDTGSLKGKNKAENDGYPSDSVPPTAPALAAQQGQRMEAAMGDAILRFLRIRKPRRNDIYDLDAVRTRVTLFMERVTDSKKGRDAA